MKWNKEWIRFIVVMLFQVLLFNQIQFFGVCRPFIFILFLMMMPITLPSWLDMLIGALVGLLMDIACNSLGVHVASCVLLTYMRRPLIRNLVLEYERLNGEISRRTIGVNAFVKYTILLVPTYHLAVFMLSAWGFSHIGWTLLQTVVSSIVSVLLVLGYDALRK